MINNKPLVSIIIPLYNGSNYISEAINCALNQTYSNIEIIVVNDGSKDNGAGRDIVLTFGDKVKYFEKENGGVSTALNYGIRNMTGKYFSWLSHDDIYLPNHIENQVNCLKNGDNINAVISNTMLYYQFHDKTIKRKDRFSIFPKISMPVTHYYYWYYACSFLVKKDFFETTYIFEEKYRISQDISYIFHVLHFSKIHFNESFTSLRREHDNTFNRSDVQEVNVIEYHAILKELIEKYGFSFFITNIHESKRNSKLYLIVLYADLLSNKYNDLQQLFLSKTLNYFNLPIYFKSIIKSILFLSAKLYSIANRIYRKLLNTIYFSK
jgi:glycosyltransferase involved in cell wall biosynthesis